MTPPQSGNLNGGSFVQDALATRRGYQYTAFYLDVRVGARNVCLSRRKLPQGSWETLRFADHEQVQDDGHNNISMGICEGDGSIHLAYDCHNSDLALRRSIADLTSDPASADWSVHSFSAIFSSLSGLEGLPKARYFSNITYPRFLNLSEPAGAMLMELRVGMSGLGNDLIFIYKQTTTGNYSWSKRGVYLEGVENNAYINGIDCDSQGRLHVTWCYRDFVPATLEQSRQQAGPNGPENNHDLCYAWSPPEADGSGPGLRWFTSSGHDAGEAEARPIVPTTPEIVVFPIPKNSGILNQEAQFVDSTGGVHVLNREFVDGFEHWFHYNNQHTGLWRKRVLPLLPPSTTSARGKVLQSKPGGKLYFLLPQSKDLVILSTPLDENETWEEVLVVANAGGESGMEPLFDRRRLLEDGALSMFLGVLEPGEEERTLMVVDVAL